MAILKKNVEFFTVILKTEEDFISLLSKARSCYCDRDTLIVLLPSIYRKADEYG